MAKVATALTLVFLYAGYSLLIYTKGTQEDISLPAGEQVLVTKGKALYQQHNCQSCHQLYGLGGYLGPELTTAYSDKTRGEAYLKAMLQSGGNRMPNFSFSEEEINQLIAYLKYVDSTATPLKTASR
jgi:nitric oxide reductase subunit C